MEEHSIPEPTAAPPTPQPTRPDVREGPLADSASRLLRHGFVAVFVQSSDSVDVRLRTGFAGDTDRRALLQQLVKIGEAAEERLGLHSVDVTLDRGHRLVYRHQGALGGVQLWLAGEETPGEHRKSTNRSLRGVLKHLHRGAHGAHDPPSGF